MISTSWTTAPSVVAALQSSGGPAATTISARRTDWGLRGARARAHHVGEALRALNDAKRAPTLVVLTAGLEVYVIAAAMRLFRRTTHLVVVDFLMPESARLIRAQRWALGRVDAWGCIRSGDISTLRDRFGVDVTRCQFIPFPPTIDVVDTPDAEAPADGEPQYLYAAGSAHRDWATLLAALDNVDCDAVISGDTRLPQRFPNASARIRFLGPQSPEDGRELARRAAVVVVPLQETMLPAGPVVLVDAMALGRPVVATDTNGTRDYIRSGVSGWLVPAGEPDALAAKLNEVLADPTLRERVGQAAKHAAVTEFSAKNFAEKISELSRAPLRAQP